MNAPLALTAKELDAIQVMAYDTLNCFYVTNDGTLIQKVHAPNQAGSDGLLDSCPLGCQADPTTSLSSLGYTRI